MKSISYPGMAIMLASLLLPAVESKAQWSPSGTSTTMEIGRTGKVRIGQLTNPDNVMLNIISNLPSNTLTYSDFGLSDGYLNINNPGSATAKMHFRLNNAGTWSASSVMYGVLGTVYDVTTLNNSTASESTVQGGAFSINITNPITSTGTGTYLLSGTRTTLNGSITNYPANGIVSALLAQDFINGTGTWAGYFQGRGYFSGNVGIGTTAPSAKLHVVGTSSLVGNTAVTGTGTISQYLKVKSPSNLGPTMNFTAIAAGAELLGVYSEAGLTGGSGQTIGVWGRGYNGTTSVGVHGDGYGDDNTGIGVWGSGYGTTSYGVYGDAAYYAGYFDGDVHTTGTYSSSDQKLKKNIQPLTGAMGIISALSPKTYEFRIDEFPSMNLRSGTNMGFIAQDLEKVLPALVKDTRSPAELDKDGNVIHASIDFKAVDYVSLVPVLVAGMQEQQQQIEAKDERIAELEERLSRLEARAGIDNGSISPKAVLQQNVPNPFNQNTVIRFTLPEQTNDAQVLVFDMNGKQIKRIPLRNGDSSVTVNGSELSVGMYLYSLIVNGQEVDTKRMILTQ